MQTNQSQLGKWTYPTHRTFGSFPSTVTGNLNMSWRTHRTRVCICRVCICNVAPCYYTHDPAKANYPSKLRTTPSVCIHLAIQLTIQIAVHLAVQPAIHPDIYPDMQLPIHLATHLVIHLVIRLAVHLITHLAVHLASHLAIHLAVHLSVSLPSLRRHKVCIHTPAACEQQHVRKPPAAPVSYHSASLSPPVARSPQLPTPPPSLPWCYAAAAPSAPSPCPCPSKPVSLWS